MGDIDIGKGKNMDIDFMQLRKALEQSWDKDTAYPAARKEASAGSSHGQCWVTALIVQDYFGGNILVHDYGVDDAKHFWNRLPDGVEIDLTADQFEDGVVPHPPLETTGSPYRGWNPRYRKLSNRVREVLHGEDC